jgi:hypothetical protein
VPTKPIALALKEIEPAHRSAWIPIKHIDEMQEVGRAMAAQEVTAPHFAGFPV